MGMGDGRGRRRGDSNGLPGVGIFSHQAQEKHVKSGLLDP